MHRDTEPSNPSAELLKSKHAPATNDQMPLEKSTTAAEATETTDNVEVTAVAEEDEDLDYAPPSDESELEDATDNDTSSIHTDNDDMEHELSTLQEEQIEHNLSTAPEQLTQSQLRPQSVFTNSTSNTTNMSLMLAQLNRNSSQPDQEKRYDTSLFDPRSN